MEISIPIVDGNPIIRYGLWKLLSAEPDFQVIGNAENCTECFEQIGILNPDVVILDLEMNDSHGSTAIRSLQTQYPKIKTIVYTLSTNDWVLNEVIKAGVRGYVVKKSDPSCLISAIRIVNQGERYLDPAVVSKLMQAVEFIEQRQLQHRMITEQEMEILKLIAKGYRNKEIAKSLFIAECTVKVTGNK